jgi:hypothetical protein
MVSALLRRTNDSGGQGVVLARGNVQGGGILVLLVGACGESRVVERGIGPDGKTALIDSTPADDPQSYWQRRRSRDPDLWVVELDSPSAERFTAETILVG